MKPFHHILRNQSGSMLIQILIASVMATTMALMISTMMTDSFKGMSNVEQLQAAMDLRSNTEILLAVQNNCTRNFGPTGQNLTLGTTVLNSPLVNAAGTTVINVGSASAPLYNKARILSYTIQQVGPPISVAPDYVVLAEMKLMLEKVGQGFGSNQVQRSLMLTAKLTGAGGNIVTCVAGSSLPAGTTDIIANPGSATFPNGLVIKWGTFLVTNDNAGGNVSFVTPFPTNVFTVTVQSPGGTGNSQDNAASVDSWNVNGFHWINARDNTPITGTYFAIGN